MEYLLIGPFIHLNFIIQHMHMFNPSFLDELHNDLHGFKTFKKEETKVHY